nr:Chain A, FOSW [Homo sapiens]5FV8_B Chain B, FOSW [Homo sapiens]
AASLDELQAEIEQLEERNYALRKEIEDLQKQLEKLGAP